MRAQLWPFKAALFMVRMPLLILKWVFGFGLGIMKIFGKLAAKASVFLFSYMITYGIEYKFANNLISGEAGEVILGLLIPFVVAKIVGRIASVLTN